MRRLLGLAGGLTVVLGSLAACDSTGSEEPQPSAAPSSAVTIALEPAANIRDGEQVAVTVTGLETKEPVWIAQCLAERGNLPALDACALWRGQLLRADQGGTTDGDYRLDVVIRRGRPTETVCTEVDCVLAVVDAAEAVIASTPIAWEGGVAEPPQPTLTLDGAPVPVNSDPNLVRADVSGLGFLPGERIDLAQCPPADDDARPGDAVRIAGGDCLYDYGVRVRADERGAFTVEVMVAIKFQRSNNELIDCREPNADCLIARTTTTDSAGSRLAVVSLPPLR